MANTDRILYLDMDGVISDFNKQVIKYTKLSLGEPLDSDLLTQKYGRKELLTIMDSGGEEFFSEMPIMKDMYELKSFIFNNFINIKILSCIKGNPPATDRINGKLKWLKTYSFNLPDANIILIDKSVNKQKYARPNDILIDDMEININQWNQRGGIGILHKNSKDTIRQLSQYV
jgi:hypothetical protein